MIIEIKELDGGMKAILNGRLDTPAAVKAQQEIGPLLENADKEIVFDCTNLEYCLKSEMHNFGKGRPKIAIIDPNTLSALGLKQILQNVMPIMTVDIYGSFMELSANKPDEYFHYFTAMNIVLENKAFFLEHRQKTIVLTLSLDGMSQLSGFHCLCTNVTEEMLIRSVLTLQQHAHGHGEHLPPMPDILKNQCQTSSKRKFSLTGRLK